MEITDSEPGITRKRLEALLETTLNMNKAVWALMNEETPLARHHDCWIFLKHAARTVLDAANEVTTDG